MEKDWLVKMSTEYIIKANSKEEAEENMFNTVRDLLEEQYLSDTFSIVAKPLKISKKNTSFGSHVNDNL